MIINPGITILEHQEFQRNPNRGCVQQGANDESVGATAVNRAECLHGRKRAPEQLLLLVVARMREWEAQKVQVLLHQGLR